MVPKAVSIDAGPGRPASGKSARRWLAAKAALALSIAMIAGEALLRVYTWGRGWTPNCYAAQLQLFRPEARCGYDLAPGFRLRSGAFTVATNSRGLRGPEIATTKPPGVRRIAIVGGSSAFGYFVSDGQEAARLLEGALRERGCQVEVVNGAVPGYNLYQSTLRFRETLAPLKPDFVIVYAGWNDLPYVVSPNPRAERFRVRPVAPAWERILGHSTLYGFLFYRIGGGPARMTPAGFAAYEPTTDGARQFRENLSRLADEADRVQARLVLCAQATAAHPKATNELRQSLAPDAASQASAIRLGEWLHATLIEFAATRGLPLLDAYAEIEPDETMLRDYVHLTEAGERRLADIWRAGLEANGLSPSETSP